MAEKELAPLRQANQSWEDGKMAWGHCMGLAVEAVGLAGQRVAGIAWELAVSFNISCNTAVGKNLFYLS